ncbi:NTP transferase domain-containing protein [Endomicrobium sp. AH-315-J14]|nr:NTP transferase domain-containing protein [Endomicrobium sp. AH-315-J14]
MTRIKHALVMAAGRGQRMMPLTAAMPKPMAPFKGTTLIAHGIGRLRKRIPNIHITVGYKGAMLAQHVIENGVTSVFNTDQKPNSWWIYNTLLRDLDEPIYVLTCDNVVDLDLDLLEQEYADLDKPACMLVPVTPVDGLEGDFIRHEDQLVTDIDRDKPSDIYCSGIQVINPARVNQLTEDQGGFYTVWNQLMAQQEVKVSRVYPKEWISVDTFEQLAAINQA